jgi:hypothetical protein
MEPWVMAGQGGYAYGLLFPLTTKHPKSAIQPAC